MASTTEGPPTVLEPFLSARSDVAERAQELALAAPAATPGTTNEQLREMFQRHASAPAIAVVEGGRPVGLVNRRTFMESYARPFAHDLWGRKSCEAFMDRRALVVDAAVSIAELARRASDGASRALEDGFIVTDQGHYLGLGSGPALVRALSALEAARAHQIEQSIAYASVIQRSMLSTSHTELHATLPDHALLWEPRDVVGGDCYWFRRTEGGLKGAVLDCTGHGVPGAFMTVIALAALEQAFSDPASEEDPGLVLGRMSRAIKARLHQDMPGKAIPSPERAGGSDDGLDGVCFFLPAAGRELRLASAHFPVLLLDAGAPAPTLLGSERASVGYAETDLDQVWSTQRVALEPETLVVMATDGCTDQIGGPKRIAFGRGRMAALLSRQRGLGAAAFAAAFRAEHERWRGEEARRDDMMMLTFTTGGRS